MGFSFHKGHGTRNDFILLDDHEGGRKLSEEQVRAFTDRRGGIGADGVIRVVRAGRIPEWTGDPDLWFMDYRNADGSIAEMCGNGLRVFVAYLLHRGYVDQPEFSVATRAGLKRVTARLGGDVAVEIGPASFEPDPVTVRVDGHSFAAHPVDVGNPHAVSFVSAEVLEGLTLSEAPTLQPEDRFPNGVNLEFVTVDGPGQLAMRVFERGVGETESCGTGVVAAASAYRELHGWPEAVVVRVPGGTLKVEFVAGTTMLEGPAVIVGRGDFLL